MRRIQYKNYIIEITARSVCKQITIRHRSNEDTFRMSVPVGISSSALLKVLKENEPWMQKQLQKQRNVWKPKMQSGERAWFLGKVVTLGKDGIPAGNEFLTYRAKALHDEVVRLLPLWQTRMSVHCSRIRWNDTTSKWGSCNIRTKCIMLDLKLGAMPSSLIEYILVHELNHLIHPDHSPAFHADMDRWIPDWKKRKEQLNHFGPLFLPPEEQEQL